MSYKAPSRKQPNHGFVREINEFMDARKELQGACDPQSYVQAREQAVFEVDYPILVNGELRGPLLKVISHPHETPLVWSIVLIYPPAVSRLDYTHLQHLNPPCINDESHPASVAAPHIHPWRLNQRFMTSRKTTNPIPIAMPIEEMKDFGWYLRWFCQQNKIVLPHDHCIQLLHKQELFP
jgi:hypothetical protein